MKTMQWEATVHIFGNRWILKGLMTAIGLPFGVLILVILFLSGGRVLSTDAKYALFLIGALFLVTYLMIMAIYGGTYEAGFILDDQGITNYTQARQRRKNGLINGMLVVSGLFGGRLWAAGSGMMAQSRQSVSMSWKEIQRVRYDPKQRTILVRGHLNRKLAVFCTQENYDQVETMIREKMK